MERKYMLAGLALLSGGLMAQQSVPTMATMKADGEFTLGPSKGISQGLNLPKGGGGTIYFSEDFANGLAGNNGGVGAWTVSGADGAIWQYDTDGPNGGYSNPVTQIIASTTVANGFMIFDSDLNFTDGNGDPLPPSQYTPLNGNLESPVMDLSAATNVRLEFETRMRFCCTDNGHFVEASTDGGATWPIRVGAEYGIPVNSDPGTFTGVVNLSSLIPPGSNNVKIRFVHNGSNDGGSMSHYFWQVDDVKVVEAPRNDMRINKTWMVADPATYDDPLIRNQEYIRIPVEQAIPFAITCAYYNNGGATQPNVTGSVTITQNGNTFGPFTQTYGNLAPNTEDTLSLVTTWTPTAPGPVSVEFSLTSDSTDVDDSDNMITRTFVVTDAPAANEYAVMAVDTNARDGNISLSQNSTYSVIGTTFQIEEPNSMAYAFGVVFGTTTTPGAVVNVSMDDGTNTVAEALAFEIMPYHLTAIGGAVVVPIPFDAGLPVALDPALNYRVLVENPGGDTVALGLSGDVTPGGLYGYDNDDATLYRFIGWGNSAPMVRLFLANAPVGISEVDGLTVTSVYPNPFSDNTTINLELIEGRQTNILVTDVNGRLVLEKNLGNLAAGMHRIDLDGSQLSTGVYNCAIISGNSSISRRLVVVR